MLFSRSSFVRAVPGKSEIYSEKMAWGRVADHATGTAPECQHLIEFAIIPGSSAAADTRPETPQLDHHAPEKVATPALQFSFDAVCRTSYTASGLNIR